MSEPNMNDALIVLDNLSVGYNGRPVLSGISLAIVRGGFTAVLGANGSGKSTLLKTVLGLLPPVAGRMAVAPGAQPVFGYVPQSAQLDPMYPLTGFDVALMGTYGRIGPGRFVPASERAFTAECLASAGADTFARKRFAELSGGQKQRVLIARALATRPEVLALDEPTAGVDHEASYAVMQFIAQICEEKKIAVLLVTHDFGAVRRHARQIVWLYNGRAIQGDARELLTPERMAQIFELEVK